MTVKCINKIDKETIIRWYKYHEYSIKELAEIYMTSPRTISRVLQEADIPTPLAQRTGESYACMKILKDRDVNVSELDHILCLGLGLMYANVGSQLEQFEDMPF